MVVWFWIAIVVLAGYAIWLYNRLVGLRNQVREAWSGIDVQLKRRSDLVPNLVAVVRQYAAHERELLEEVARTRAGAAAVDPARRSTEESALGRSLRHLFAVAENYPQLRADQNFLRLQADLVEVEDHLQMARRYYNGSVRDQNNLVESFPANLFAGPLGFRPAGFFEIECATERSAPSVSMD